MFLRVGLDLDNTIIDYRSVFATAAQRLGMAAPVAARGKEELRDRLRARAGGEAAWQELQAYVYGTAIAEAEPYPEFEVLLQELVERKAFIAIVSHKMRFAAAAPDGPDLHEAAMRWLIARGVVGAGRIDPANVYFEATRPAKLERITALGLTHFVDDLAEVLEDAAFPAATRAIRFYDSWNDVRQVLASPSP